MTKTRRPAGRRDFRFDSTVSIAFEDGCSEIEALKEEIEGWKDSLESNNMEHLPKYEEVEECYNTLETALDALQGIEVPDFLEGEAVTYTQDTRQQAQSRSGRMGNAENALSAAKDGAQSWLDENDELEVMDDADKIEDGEEEVTQEEVDERQAQREKCEEFVNELEQAIDELGNVSFPGMY
jgi:hypothetical protein